MTATITVPNVTKSNATAIAKALYGALPNGEKATFKERADMLQVLIAAMRKERDADENANTKTRPRLEVDKIVENAIGKPLGELAAVSVPILGMPVKISQVFKLASTENHPLKGEAEKFLSTHGLELFEVESSRGKNKMEVRRAKGYKAPAPAQKAA